MLPTLPRYRRYHGYDYSRGAAMFITITTSPRRPWFGRVAHAQAEHTPLGEEVEKSLLSMPSRVPGVRLYKHVLMPDHLHLRIYLEAGLPDPLKTLGAFIGNFKSYTTHLLWQMPGTPKTLWQDNYHDRICMSKRMIEAVERYIAYNPLKYEMRYNHPECLAIHEPLESDRLDPEDFWRGIGEVGLLNEEREMVALRVSRKVTNFDEVVRRCRKGADRFTFISGFISPGERAVLDMLLATPSAKFVQVLAMAMRHDYLPASQLLPAIHDGRAAVLARGNSEEEFSRNACLDLNEAIIPIARQHGTAIYWKNTGPEAIK